MSNVINNTRGEVIATLQDGTTNSSTGLTLIGRNFTNYGNLQNENFVYLLENFAAAIPPGESVGFSPITGTVWYDTGNNLLKVYDGTNFNIVSGRVASNSTPTAKNIGDQWWDTTNLQLKSWDGTTWQLIGPGYTNSQGKSGAIVETVVDTTNISHTVVATYTNNNLISVTSFDNPFIVTDYLGYATVTIRPGINLYKDSLLYSTANNSVYLNGLASSSFARTDISTTFASNVSVNGDILLGSTKLYTGTQNLVLENTNPSGNVNIYVNSTIGNIGAMTIDGSSGLVYLGGNPVSDKGAVTKIYADTLNNSVNANLSAEVNQLNSNIAQVRVDYLANISAVTVDYNTKINNLSNSTSSSISTLSTTTDSRLNFGNATSATLQSEIGAINNYLPFLANIDSPVFTGFAKAPTRISSDNSANIATTAYVTGAISTVNINLTNAINSVATSAQANLVNAIAPFANISSPIFTGTPKAPTPTAGDNSTKIATTAFVAQATSAIQFNYTVATTAPGDVTGVLSSTNGAAGNNGDFWFQIG